MSERLCSCLRDVYRELERMYRESAGLERYMRELREIVNVMEDLGCISGGEAYEMRRRLSRLERQFKW